jgi:hypothetical protein
MKKSLCVALGILAIVASGCDAKPPVPSAAPAPSSPGTAGSEPDFTYDSLVELLGNPDDFAVARILGERLPKMGPGSVPALQEVLDDAASLELDAVEHELLMRYWARYDPAAATWYALTKAPRAFRVGAIYATLRPWAKQDPQKALETARVWTNEGGDAGAATQVALVRGWYESGKPGVEQYIHDIGIGFDRQRALTAYSTAVIRDKGVDALVKWAEALPETDAAYKLEVFRSIGRAVVPFDLAAAQRFCDAHCEGPFGSNVRDRIASRWADKDGAAALEWLGKAKQNEDRDAAIRYTFAVWSRRVPGVALPWMKAKLEAKPPDPWLVPMLPIYARMLGKGVEPEEGLAVADKLAGPQERESIMIEILRYWRQKDEAAAEAWLKTAKLSDEMLASVRAPQTKVEQLEQERDGRLAQRPKS